MSSPFHFTLAQLNPVVGDIAGNLALLRKTLSDVPAQTDLVILPELFVTGYSPEDLTINASFLQTVEDHVQDFARETGHTHILLPCPWRVDGKILNTVHLIGDGKIQATRHKHHLPNYGVFDEMRIFTPGPMPAPIPFRGHNLGVLICEDVWYEDVPAHLKAQGADCLIVVNASPFAIDKHELRLDICRARVRETGLPLIYVNQIGGQDDLVFDGTSFILNQSGDCILRTEEFAEDIVHFSFSPLLLERGGTKGGGPPPAKSYPTSPQSQPSPSNSPSLKKEGEDKYCYAAINLKTHRTGPALIYQAAMTGLRDYALKNNFPGVLLGLSGGIDSAISAALAVDALGPAALQCVMLPSVFTSQESRDDAVECCRLLGLSLDTIPIHEPVECVESALASHFTANTPDITHQNIQARLRGVILMALSNATGKMLLSTGNKSEMAVGYATLYGDMCGGYNALKDIYKTDVFAIAAWRNANKPDHAFGPAGPVMPASIFTKPPTAELKPGQTDQDTLPPYATLDAILKSLIEDGRSPADIAQNGHDPATIHRIAQMLTRAEYKRRQSPPGPKITNKAFGRERRYPMTNGFKG